MVSHQSVDLVDSIIDEVALEGLDGITLEALWLRLANRFHKTMPLPKPFTEQIWSICVQVRPFNFYELEVPREQLILIDRYEFVDPDIGIILEPDNVPEDIYPHCPIDDRVTGNKGSCSTYQTRKDISNIARKLGLDEALEKYGQSLVIVATQAERERALIGDTVCPTLELNVMQYCFLERVGRSRYHGEVTQGKLSLNCLKEDPKSLFYHRKYLLRHKLITKQMHHQKSVSSGHSCSGSLLHLPRFYVERKPKIIFLAEQVIDILKSKENCVAEYKEIKKALQLEGSIKKLFKTAYFHKVIKADLKVPYRTLYPNAESKEWQRKNYPSHEKLIHVVQLVDPNVDVNELWNKDEVHEDEDQFELDISHHKYSVPFLKQTNMKVEEAKSDGIYQGDLAKEVGLTKLQSRTMLRNLVKANLLATFMNDMGRQRLTKYFSKKFEKSSDLSKQFEKEMDKIMKLTKTVKERQAENVQKSDEKKVQTSEGVVDGPKDVKSKSLNESEIHDEKNVQENTEKQIVSRHELRHKFNAVNSVIRRYRLTKCIPKYQCTSAESTGKSVDPGNRQKEKRVKEKSITEQTAYSLSESSEAISMYNSIVTNVVVENPLNAWKTINESFGFMEDVKINEKRDISNITYRLLRRANMIIESVKENQIIDDTMKLVKMISEEEDKEGYDVKIDKKSLLRLLCKLANDNLIKIIRLTLSGNGTEKHLTFICDPTIDTDHTVITSAVEQAKVKFCLTISNRAKLIQKSTDRVKSDGRRQAASKSNSCVSSRESSQTKKLPPYKMNAKMARAYGYGPKFVRMKMMHLLLYYLAYEHPGEQCLARDEQIRALESAGHTIPRSVRDEMSTVYKTEVGWKMFVPPLPTHNGWPRGWALMCDVLLRLPLSVFLKLHNVSFVIPELESYIRHPIRKHYLVRDLPLNIRNAMFYARKYIFNIHQTVTKLCFVGLVQFGPQRLKEKDQVFVYVNRRSELLDTTSTAPSYHKTEDKPYPATRYTFENIGVVEKYWYDMWNICVNTPLGDRLVVQGKDIFLEELEKKTEMVETVSARTPEEVEALDTGKVPGDRRGAAGIDSAFFSHLKRNWNWLSGSSYRCRESLPGAETAGNERALQRQTYLSQIKVKPVRFTEFAGLKKVTGPSTMSAQELRRAARSRDSATTKTRKHQVLTSHGMTRQRTYVRRMLPRKQSSRPRTKYDETDYRALQRMQKLRVDWEPHEDNMLLVCKVAMNYLCPNPRKQFVTFTAVRDFLRSCSSSSYNKTSRACQRRLLYMLKRRDAVNSVTLGLEEIKQNYYINRRFGGAMDRIKAECDDPVEQERRVSETFRELVSYVAKKYFDLAEIGPKEPTPLPRTGQEFNLYWRVVRPAKPFGHRGFTRDVRQPDDVHSATINTVIHSSMCCGRDRRGWAYQLFKVYQWYTETLLRNAMTKIRADQMLAVKKSHACKRRKYGGCMPMNCSQYQLSTYYAYKFNTKWPYEMFREAHEILRRLVERRDGVEIQPVTGGAVMAVHDFIVGGELDMDIEIPDQVIMLDPRLHEKDETYLRIARRYQDILESLDQPGRDERRLRRPPGNDEEVGESVGPATKRARKSNDGAEARESGRKKVLEISGPEDVTAQEEEENIARSGVRKRNYSVGDDGGRCEEPLSKKKRTCEVQEEEEKNQGSRDQVSQDQNKQDKVTQDQENQGQTSQDQSNPGQGTQDQDSQDKANQDQTNQVQTSQDHIHQDQSSQVQVSQDQNSQVQVNQDQNIQVQVNEDQGTQVHVNQDQSSQVQVNQDHSLRDDPSNPKTPSHPDPSDPPRAYEGGYTSVSDIVRDVLSSGERQNSYQKFDEPSDDIQRKYTRIALLRMREELNDLSLTDSHHAHDLFVVNMCRILYAIRSRDKPTTSKSSRDDLTPLDRRVADRLIDDVRSKAIFPKSNISYADCKNKIRNATIGWPKFDAVYKYVRERKEIGASAQELKDRFYEELGQDLYEIASQLTKHHVFLRSGVTCVRYVHHRFASPWLIRSYRFHRHDEDGAESWRDPTKDPTIDVGALISEEALSRVDGVATKASRRSSESDDEEENGKTRENENVMLPQKEIDIAARQLDFTTAEEIRVLMKPWIRIDGTINRKVLDRMLGAVLTYCLTHPGVTLARVQTRFVPALQPFHTRELIEMLIALGCLERKLLERTRVTLFSKPAEVKPKPGDEWASEEATILEPATCATLRFSVFLDKESNEADFIP